MNEHCIEVCWSLWVVGSHAFVAVYSHTGIHLQAGVSISVHLEYSMNQLGASSLSTQMTVNVNSFSLNFVQHTHFEVIHS